VAAGGAKIPAIAWKFTIDVLASWFLGCQPQWMADELMLWCINHMFIIRCVPRQNVQIVTLCSSSPGLRSTIVGLSQTRFSDKGSQNLNSKALLVGIYMVVR